MMVKLWGGPNHGTYHDIVDPEHVPFVITEVNYEYSDVFDGGLYPAMSFVTGGTKYGYIRDKKVHNGQIVYYYGRIYV